jgi:PAS domain S-box-containing protein
MDIASVHHVTNIVIPAFLISAGIVFYSAVHAAVVGVVGRPKPLYLAFSLTCLCAGIFQVGTVGYYKAGSVAAAAYALHWQAVSFGVLGPALFAFIALYTGQRRIKLWLIGVVTVYALLLVVSLTQPYTARFSTLEMAGVLRLPWGEDLARFKGTPSVWNGLVRLAILSIFIWAAARAAIQYRRGERRAAVFLAAFLVIAVATMIEGGLVDLGVIDFFYTGGFSYLALAVLMSISMGIELRDRTIALEASTAELHSTVGMLERSEERLRRALDAGRVGTWEWNILTNEVSWSDGVEKMFGLETGSFQGTFDAYRALIYPDDLPVLDDSVKRAFEQDIPYTFEHRLTWPDGEIRWLLGQGQVFRDSDGRPVSMRGTVLDITDRKRAEEAIRDRLKFEGLISDLSAGFVKAAAHELEAKIVEGLELIGRFLGVDRVSIGETSEDKKETSIRYSYVGPGIRPLPPTVTGILFPWYTRMLNAKKAVVVSKLLEDLPPEAEVERQFALREGIKSTLIVPLEIGGSVIGGMGFTAFHSERSWPDDLVQRLRFVGEIFANALNRKQAEETLKESEERYRNLFENAHDMIQSVSSDGRFLYVNQAWNQTMGYTNEDLRTLTIFNILHPSCKADCMEAFRKVMSGEAQNNVQVTFIAKDGRPIEAEGNVSCRFLKDGVVASQGIFRDITERKRAEVEKLKNQIEAEKTYLQDEIKVEHNFEEIIGRSPNFVKILHEVEQVASTDSTVLILGETGTGKELVARAIHNISPRHDRALVKVNCASLPETLIESELFGHEKGAFTGALSRNMGRFELADGGTIFLDEIGDLPLGLQVKLLRVLQEGEFERLGSSKAHQVNVRVIAATNRDLAAAIDNGTFRKDLYFRLNVFPIKVPPLRDRKEDIPVLVRHFVSKYAAKAGKKIDKISKGSMDKLSTYHWPGNIRELENIIERAIIISPGPTLDIGEQLELRPTEPSPQQNARTLKENEQMMIREALEESNWVIEGKQGAAVRLDIPSSTLRDRIQKYGIEKPQRQS